MFSSIGPLILAQESGFFTAGLFAHNPQLFKSFVITTISTCGIWDNRLLVAKKLKTTSL
jgi:hypothetical protein